MRKYVLLAILLIIALASPLFADDPPAGGPTASFAVKTSIDPINKMKITNSAVNESNFDDNANAFSGTVDIVSSGPQANINQQGVVTMNAHISTLSNNRKGYTVYMSASPLTNTNYAQAVINYTVSVVDSTNATISYNTKTSETAATIIVYSSLGELDAESLPISVQIVRSELDSAVEGTYEGSVTFEYVANN